MTQSAVDAARTPTAVKAVHDLGRLLAGNIAAHRDALRRIRMSGQSYAMADYVDAVHVAGLIRSQINDPSIAAAASNVQKSVKACVVASAHHGSTVTESNGLSLWFPAYPAIYYNFRGKYLELNCNTPTSGWVRFLDAYHV